MSCNDVFMILFARKSDSINKRFADVYSSITAKPATENTLDRLGTR